MQAKNWDLDRPQTTLTSEERLLQEAQRGSTRAYGELVRLHERAVYGLAHRMLGTADDAEDVAQDVFVTAWRALPNFRGGCKLGTWLHRITVNASLKKLAALKRNSCISLDDHEAPQSNVSADPLEEPLQKTLESGEKAAIRQALDTLSPKHKATVVLYYFQDRSCDDIAEIMECSVGTVWSRLHYACRKLKPQLAELREGCAGASVSSRSQEAVRTI